jgi:hypothetical protein
MIFVIYLSPPKKKGGGYAPDSYEESMWDPKVIMPALGIRPIGHVKVLKSQFCGVFYAAY